MDSDATGASCGSVTADAVTVRRGPNAPAVSLRDDLTVEEAIVSGFTRHLYNGVLLLITLASRA